jgi:Flp pilus assembly protein TadB
MEAIPWLSFTAAGGGWTLFGLCGFAMIMGWLTPRWVVAMLQARIVTLEAENKELLAQNALLLREGLPVTNATLNALRQAAEGHGGHVPPEVTDVAQEGG